MDRRPDITEDPDPFQDDDSGDDDVAAGADAGAADGPQPTDRARARRRTRDTGGTTTDDDTGRAREDDDGGILDDVVDTATDAADRVTDAASDVLDEDTDDTTTDEDTGAEDTGVVPDPADRAADALQPASDAFQERVVDPAGETIRDAADQAPDTAVPTGAAARISEADADVVEGALRTADPFAATQDAIRLGATAFEGTGVGGAGRPPDVERVDEITDAGEEVIRRTATGAADDPFGAAGGLAAGGLAGVGAARGISRLRRPDTPDTPGQPLGSRTDLPDDRPQTFPDVDELTDSRIDEFLSDDRGLAQPPRGQQRQRPRSPDPADSRIIRDDDLGTPDPVGEQLGRQRMAERRALEDTLDDPGMRVPDAGPQQRGTLPDPDTPLRQPRSAPADTAPAASGERGTIGGLLARQEEAEELPALDATEPPGGEPELRDADELTDGLAGIDDVIREGEAAGLGGPDRTGVGGVLGEDTFGALDDDVLAGTRTGQQPAQRQEPVTRQDPLGGAAADPAPADSAPAGDTADDRPPAPPAVRPPGQPQPRPRPTMALDPEPVDLDAPDAGGPGFGDDRFIAEIPDPFAGLDNGSNGFGGLDDPLSDFDDPLGGSGDDAFAALDEGVNGRGGLDDGLDDLLGGGFDDGLGFADDLGLDTGDPLAGLDNNRYGYKEEEK